ncbi:MAG TPA: hypothetical protein VLK56_02700 [Solirubrobacterales bacterium]|nr:hypothetical protein [Solirubrobacterales bacterium]
MAIGSLIVLLVALGIAALINSQPWAPSPVAPQLSVAPGLGAALGDSVAVSPGRQLAVAPAEPASGGKARFAAADRRGAAEPAPGPRLGIAAAVAVSAPGPVSAAEGAPKPPSPEPQPAPEAAPAPEALPVAAPAPAPATEPGSPPPTQIAAGDEGGPTGPIAGGVGVEDTLSAIRVCEGDDYTLSFSQGDDEASAEIVPASPAPGTVPHEVTVYFGTSSEGEGFYLALLDGQPIDIGDSFRPLDPGSDCALIDPKLLDAVEAVEGSFAVRFEGVGLGETLEPGIP